MEVQQLDKNERKISFPKQRNEKYKYWFKVGLQCLYEFTTDNPQRSHEK